MKKMIENSKKRIAAAGIVAAILIISCCLAVKADGMQGGKLVLGLFLSILLFGAMLLKVKFPKPVSVVLLFLLPAGTLCCVEFYTSVPWNLTPPIFFLNYLMYLLLVLFGTVLFGSSRWGSIFGTVIPMVFGLVNYYVVSFRSSPVVPWDLYSLGTAVSVADNYELELPFRLLFVLFGFCFLIWLSSRTSLVIPGKKWKARLVSVVLSAGLIFGYVEAVKTDEVGELVGLDTILFTPNVLYRNNGLVTAFLSNLKYLDVEKPEGYSVEKVKAIAKDGDGDEGKTESIAVVSKETPNIIVIMNEAFSDLSVYGDFDTSEDYMPFIRSLTKEDNAEKGSLYVSVKGGNTANTEFEFLTGNTMAFLPAGSVPYQQYIKADMPSLASHLRNMGYDTSALHPYRAQGWCRDKVYPWLGFENIYFREDFQGASKLRGYVDDASAFEKLVELYQNKEEGKPMFSFEVTMQNHGGYSKEYEDLFPDIKILAYQGKETTNTEATEKYLTLIKKTDDAFKELLEYFENQEEPTVILMFGDHQPSDYICNPILRLMGQDSSVRETSVDEFRKGYVVPYILWANYDFGAEDGISLSANYLGGYLLEKIGLGLSGYQSWLSDLRQKYPVVTGNFYGEYAGNEDNTGQENEIVFYDWEDLSGDSDIHDYSILQYNNISDSKHRLTNFFE